VNDDKVLRRQFLQSLSSKFFFCLVNHDHWLVLLFRVSEDREIEANHVNKLECSLASSRDILTHDDDLALELAMIGSFACSAKQCVPDEVQGSC
jgi:hypothetical protein